MCTLLTFGAYHGAPLCYPAEVRFGFSFVLIVGLMLGRASTSAADPASKAQVLFDEARVLTEAGDYERACPMFAESQRMDPGGGTLLNLATCHEKQGKLASAWTEFNAALSLALRDGRQDRASLARERIAELSSRVPRLLVVVPEEGDGLKLTVRVDGVEMSRNAWGVALPVDPGQHRVDAFAPGRRRFVTAIALRADGATLTVEIPVLERETRQEPSASMPLSTGDRPSTLFYVGLGAAGVGYATSAVTGVLAWLAHESVTSKCNTTTNACSDPTAIDDASRARTMAWVSTIALVVGVIGTAIVLIAPSRKAVATGSVGFAF